MQLAWVRVLNFKSVLDSEWFRVDDLTCLVGKNESGKTAILEALEKLNTVRSGRADFVETEYPRMNWSEYEEGDDVDVALETRWTLDEFESNYIEELGGPDSLKTNNVTISKDFDNKIHWGVALDYKKAVDNAVADSGLEDAEKEAFGNVALTQDLVKMLRGKDDRSAREEAFLQELSDRWPAGSLRGTVEDFLRNRVPGFVYYSQYDRLPGKISLDQLLAAKNNNSLDEIDGSRVFLALLSMVGTTVEEIQKITTSEKLISQLEAVEGRLSKRIFKYWSQNKHLKVRFRFDEASPGDPPPFNSGKVFQTRIENTRHEATIRLDERSTGFIWFFSFLVWFSEVQRTYGDNLVVLLDEPGLTLHARAQADLLRYMKQELVPKYQVLYTTHSPFMVDPTLLLSCRTVEDATAPDGEVLGTKVGDKVLSSDADTLFPLQAALGYDLTQTLFVGKNCLLVEGPSDLLYLQWASSRLRSLGRTSLDKRWTITPCGGITKVPSFLALFGGSELNISVLTDYGAGDKKKVRELRESALLKAGRVFSADMYLDNCDEADVEDILGRGLYLAIVNATYSPDSSDLIDPASEATQARVTAEVEERARTFPSDVKEYDHYAPSRYLLENPTVATAELEGPALDRFERFFADVNTQIED